MSKWEDGLRRLFKATPSKDIHGTIINVMKGTADDRSAALTSGALADTGLMAGIVAILRPPGPKDVDALFWTEKAKYRTFNLRIKQASALGLIGPQTKRNLTVIREIRNVFAHALIEVTFNTPEIVAACNEIALSTNAQFFADRESERRTRYRFCYGCDAVFRGLLGWASLTLIFGIPASKPPNPILP
jgi:hypothetical protein